MAISPKAFDSNFYLQELPEHNGCKNAVVFQGMQSPFHEVMDL